MAIPCENPREPDSFRVTGNPEVMLARHARVAVLRSYPEVLFWSITLLVNAGSPEDYFRVADKPEVADHPQAQPGPRI